MKEFTIDGKKYSVTYYEGIDGRLVIQSAFIKYADSWYRIDENSEAGRKVRAQIEKEHK